MWGVSGAQGHPQLLSSRLAYVRPCWEKIEKKKKQGVGGCTPVIPGLGRLDRGSLQVGDYLCYTVNSMPA